jgi:hypothetical protein
MSDFLDPTVKENWQYHDEYEFWYMPYPGTNEAQAEEGVRWRGFKPWESASAPMREAVTQPDVVIAELEAGFRPSYNDGVMTAGEMHMVRDTITALLERFELRRRG